MSDLTPEQRRQIYNEEKARLEGTVKPKSNVGQNATIGCLAIFVIFIAIGSLAGGGRSGPNAQKLTSDPTPAAVEGAPSPPPSQPDKAWRSVQTFNGEAIKNTTPFTVRSPWRIRWKTRPGSMGRMNFQIYIMKPGADMVGLAANIIGAGHDESMQYEAGTFYLEINTAQPYSIEVDELR